MTESNAELAARIIRDLDELLAHLDPEIVWDNRGLSPPDHDGLIRGKDAVTRIITEWVGSWDDYRLRVEEAIDAGDGIVVLVVTESGVGRRSGVPLDLRHCYAWSFRDGLIVRGTGGHRSKEKALRVLTDLAENSDASEPA